MFKKLILALAIMALLASPVCAKSVVSSTVGASVASATFYVPTTSSVVTTYFEVGDANAMACSYMGSSVTSGPAITIQLEQSDTVPTTDGVAEPASWSIPVNQADIVTAFSGTESVWYHKAFSPIAMKYGRFKVTGTTGNATTDTVVTLKVHKQID